MTVQLFKVFVDGYSDEGQLVFYLDDPDDTEVSSAFVVERSTIYNMDEYLDETVDYIVIPEGKARELADDFGCRIESYPVAR